MATRCYFPETEAAAVSPTISSSDWGHIPGTPTRRRLRQRAADASTLTTTAYTPDGADHVSVSVNAHHRQYVSDALCAQTISGTVTGQFQTLEAHANNNLQITVGIWLVSGDGTTLRSTLLAPVRSGTEPTTSLRNTSLTSQSLTSQTAVDGDRLVIEIGLGGTPVATSGTQGHNGSIRWGGTASGGDLGVDETSALTTLRPWLQFSANLAFGVTVAADSYVVTGVATDRFTHSVPYDAAVYALSGTDVTLTFGAAGGGAFSLVLAADSYGVSGAAVNLLPGFLVAAGPSGYVVVGDLLSGLAGFRLAAVSDAYALTGTDAAGVPARRVTATADAYALTGTVAGTLAGWRLDPASAAYSVTGTDVTLTSVATHTLAAAADSYVLSGTATDRFTHSVPSDPGAYGLTGGDVTLGFVPVGAFFLDVATTAYAVTGGSVSLRADWRGSADGASYDLTGSGSALVAGFALALEGGSYVATGQSSALLGTRGVALDPSDYVLTGVDVELALAGGGGAVRLDLDAGLYQLWGDETAPVHNLGIGLDAGAYDLAGADTDLSSAPEGALRYGSDLMILRRRRRF